MALSTRRLFVAILILSLFAMAVREIGDPDFWWHLRTGQYIFETGSVPHSDIFSFTNTGREWVAHEWLAELLIYLLYRLGSFPLLIVTFAGLIAASFGITYLRCEGRPYVAGFVTILGAVATAPTWGVRPQVFTLLLASVFFYFLDVHLEKRDLRYLAPLVPLMILWVNLHSGFALGLVVIVAYWIAAAFQAARERPFSLRSPALVQLTLVLALCILVVPLNPNGVRMYSYPLETLTSEAMQRYIQEWFSPDMHLLEFQPFALLMILLIGAGILSHARISLPWTLLIVAFGYASLRSARHIPLFALAAIPILSSQITALIPKRRAAADRIQPSPPRSLRLLNWLVLALVAVACLLRVGVIVGNQQNAERIKFPANAVTYIQEWAPTARIYNTYGWGGYLIWRLYPANRVYIDGRADVYGDRFMEEYVAIYAAQPGWEDKLRRDGIELALLEPDSPLAHGMERSPNWQLEMQDDHSILFRRK